MSETSTSDDSMSSATSTASSSTPNSPIYAPAPLTAAQAIVSAQQNSDDEISEEVSSDGDESDVSMSADSSDSEDEDHDPTSHIVVQQQALPMQILVGADSSRGLKRKLSTGMESNKSNILSENLQHLKKVRTDEGLNTFWTSNGGLKANRSLLPAEIWHHIFTFVPPRALGCLLRVNKGFNAYLDPSSTMQRPVIASLSRSTAPIRSPEAIWQASRRLYRPGMPIPLKNMTEMATWQLCLSIACQYCGKKNVNLSSSPVLDPWHAGPGADGVRPVWLFGTRCCGKCLLDHTIKEIDLLLSSSVPTPLMSAVPFVFLTTDTHVVSATSLASGQQPAAVSINKYYSKAGVESIKNEFFKVKALGIGATEEWLKGLEVRGKNSRSDASRWERFDLGQGISRLRNPDVAEFTEIISRRSAVTAAAPEFYPLSGNPSPTSVSHLTSAMPAPYTPQAGNTPYSNQLPPRPDSNYGGSYPSAPPMPRRQERTREEVMEMKAVRKSEIERRCMMLDPPILPGVLAHMGAFQAANQIIHPFDDNAWELLKPRLFAQRGEAEKREYERSEHTRVIQAQQAELDMRRQAEAQSQARALGAKGEAADNGQADEYDPLRELVGKYADEVIGPGWNSGRNVNGSNSPRFAAEVLLYVRNRLYSSLAQSNGQPPARVSTEALSPHKLTLETMKWIFDTKVRPYTEQFSKEIFLCNGCDIAKFYGFEGVIQHYAAKHTSALSLGSIVVNWKSDWPEVSPFKAQPGEKPASPRHVKNGLARQANHETGAQQATHQEIQTSYIQSSTSYGAQQEPHDMSTATYPQAAGTPAFQAYQYQGLPVDMYSTYAAQAPLVQQHYSNSSAAQQSFTPSGEVAHSHDSTMAQAIQPTHQAPQPPSSTYHTGVQPLGTIRTEEYRAQLLDIAQTASSIWKLIGSVKEMPGSVRIYVVLFYVLRDFKTKYDEQPTLAMLNDGLSNNKDMRPIRNVNGLACRACILEEAYKGNSHTKPVKGSKPAEKKLLSTPQLWTHFLKTHVDGLEGPPQYDWTVDMVELPDFKKIKGLRNVNGIGEQRLQLVKDALPAAFIDTPPPIESSLDYPEPDMSYRNGAQAPQVSDSDLPESHDKHESFYSTDMKPEPGRNRVDGFHIQPSSKLPTTKPVSNSAYGTRDDTTRDSFGGYDTRDPPNAKYKDSGRDVRTSLIKEQYQERSSAVSEQTSRHLGDQYRGPDRKMSSDSYLEGPRYYNAGASLAELLANPASRKVEVPMSQQPVATQDQRQRYSPQTASNARLQAASVPDRYPHDYREQPAPHPVDSRSAADLRGVRSRGPQQLQGSTINYGRSPLATNVTPYDPAPPQKQPVLEYEGQYTEPSRSRHPQYEHDKHGYYEEEVIYVDQHGRRVPPPTQSRRYEIIQVSGGQRPRSHSPIYIDPPLQYGSPRGDSRYMPQESDFGQRQLPRSKLEEDGYERVPQQELYRYYEDQRQTQHYEPVQYLPIENRGLPPRRTVSASRYGNDPRYEPIYADEAQAHSQFTYNPRLVEQQHNPAGGDDEYDPSNPVMLAPPPRQQYHSAHDHWNPSGQAERYR